MNPIRGHLCLRPSVPTLPPNPGYAILAADVTSIGVKQCKSADDARWIRQCCCRGYSV